MPQSKQVSVTQSFLLTQLFGARILYCRNVSGPNVAGGVMLSGVSAHQTLTTTFSKLLGGSVRMKVHKRLIDVAVFLGCDFCERIHRNGPAAMVKADMFNSGPFADEALKSMDLEYVERVKRTLDFFEITDADRENAADLVKCALKLHSLEPLISTYSKDCPFLLASNHILRSFDADVPQFVMSKYKLP